MKHTLDSVIKEHLIEIQDNTQASYFINLRRAIACLRILSMDVNGSTRYVELDIQDNNTVDLPNDFMDYKFIGVNVSGRLIPLGLDNTLSPQLPVNDCGEEQNYISIDTASGIVGTYNPIYGAGGGNNRFGYYRMDYENSRIVLNIGNLPAATLVLEYIVDPSLIDGTHYVHSYEVEAVLAYLKWKSIDSARNRNLGEKDRARADWYNEKRLAKLRHKSFTLDEALQSLRKSFKQSPKL